MVDENPKPDVDLDKLSVSKIVHSLTLSHASALIGFLVILAGGAYGVGVWSTSTQLTEERKEELRKAENSHREATTAVKEKHDAELGAKEKALLKGQNDVILKDNIIARLEQEQKMLKQQGELDQRIKELELDKKLFEKDKIISGLQDAQKDRDGKTNQLLAQKDLDGAKLWGELRKEREELQAKQNALLAEKAAFDDIKAKVREEQSATRRGILVKELAMRLSNYKGYWKDKAQRLSVCLPDPASLAQNLSMKSLERVYDILLQEKLPYSSDEVQDALWSIMNEYHSCLSEPTQTALARLRELGIDNSVGERWSRQLLEGKVRSVLAKQIATNGGRDENTAALFKGFCVGTDTMLRRQVIDEIIADELRAVDQNALLALLLKRHQDNPVAELTSDQTVILRGIQQMDNATTYRPWSDYEVFATNHLPAIVENIHSLVRVYVLSASKTK